MKLRGCIRNAYPSRFSAATLFGVSSFKLFLSTVMQFAHSVDRAS